MDSVARLNELLEERGISLYALSEVSGIRYSTFNSAKRRNGQLSIDTIERVCVALQIPVYEFFMTEEDWERIEAYALKRNNRRRKGISHG